MPKIKYITDTDYEIALNKFYNGLDDFTDHIDYKIKERFNFDQEIVKEELLEGEEYKEVKYGYILTSYGRLYNLRHRRFLRARFYKNNVYTYCKGSNISLKKYFNEYGWQFDKVEILKRYVKYGWRKLIMEDCWYLHLAQ